MRTGVFRPAFYTKFFLMLLFGLVVLHNKSVSLLFFLEYPFLLTYSLTAKPSLPLAQTNPRGCLQKSSFS